MGRNEPARIGVCAVTEGGGRLARLLVENIPGAVSLDCGEGVASALRRAWSVHDGFICVMAAGIVVRAIAPLVADKRSDPAVVVCDELGRFAVSLLSGHLGGGNALARRVAQSTGGQAVLTTASDTLGLTALDLWLEETGLAAENPGDVTRLSGILVNRGRLRLFSDGVPLDLPADLALVTDVAAADCIISCRTDLVRPPVPVLRPKILVVGIGCNRGTGQEAIHAAIVETLSARHLSPLCLHSLASIDLKADEEGLLACARLFGLPISFYGKHQLNGVPGIARSSAVFRATGAYAVAEPAALLAARGGRLLVSKRKYRDVTIAIAEKNL